MPSKVIILVIKFMFLGINIFWAFIRAHFNPCLKARAKMSLSRAQNIFMASNINSIVLFYKDFRFNLSLILQFMFLNFDEVLVLSLQINDFCKGIFLDKVIKNCEL